MDYVTLYTDYLKQHVTSFKPLSIVVDASNGATGMVLEKLLPQLNLMGFTILNSTPDPEFPAHGPNPLLPGVLDGLSTIVVQKKANFGVAFDADGDRAFFVDEHGRVLPSFVIAALLFRHSEPPFVADELIYLAHHHMRLFPTNELHPSRVGVFYIKQVMRQKFAATGAEFSGHFYFKDFFGADSGLFTLVRVLSIISNAPYSLSQFAASLPKHAVRNEDLSITGKDWTAIQKKIEGIYLEQGAIIERREGLTIELPSGGWINVRPSNSEPLLRIYAGSDDGSKSQAYVNELKALV